MDICTGGALSEAPTDYHMCPEKDMGLCSPGNPAEMAPIENGLTAHDSSTVNGTAVASDEPAHTRDGTEVAKKKVGIVQLDKETKAVVARFSSVAVASQSIGVTYKQLYGAAHNHSVLHGHYWHLVDGDAPDEDVMASMKKSAPHVKWAQRQRVFPPMAPSTEPGSSAAATLQDINPSTPPKAALATLESTTCEDVTNESDPGPIYYIKPCMQACDVDYEVLWAPYSLPKRLIRPFDKTNYDYIEDTSKFDMQEDVRMVEQVDAVTGQVVRRYHSCKQAAKAMQLKYDRLYLRCYNCGSKSTTLGNFFWRFYTPPNDGPAELDEANYTPISELLKTRFLSRDSMIGASSSVLDRLGGLSAGDSPRVEELLSADSDLTPLYEAEEPPPDPEFDPQNPCEYLSKGKVIEQLHPLTKEVVRRYKGAKEASNTMKVENAKLYMRCFNHSAKSTPLGNFYWRFYSPGISPEIFEEMPIRELLRIRFNGLEYNTAMDTGGADAVGSLTFRKRKLGEVDGSDNGAAEGVAMVSIPPISSRAACGRMVEQLDLTTRKVVRRYKSVKEAAEIMQLPDREKLYLRCYRASDRTNSLCNFFWRFHTPAEDGDEVQEEDFVPIEDLLVIRYAEEVVVKKNKSFSGKFNVEDPWEMPENEGLRFSGFDDDDLSSISNYRKESTTCSSAGTSKKDVITMDDATTNKLKVVEQVDVKTKKVVMRYRGAKAAAQAMDLPYDKLYLRCYNQKRRNVSTPLGNFLWRWQENEEEEGAPGSDADYKPIEVLQQIRYTDPVDHNTPRASGSKRRKKEQPGIDESLCAYDDFATYDAMAMDEFKNMVQSPSLGQSRPRELPRAVEQLDRISEKVLRRYATAKEAATKMDIQYNKLYLRCYNRGSKSTALGNFLWRFHNPEENGPDIVPEEDFVSIEDLLAIRYAGEREAEEMPGVEDEAPDIEVEQESDDTDDDGFDARYEAAIEAAENSLQDENRDAEKKSGSTNGDAEVLVSNMKNNDQTTDADGRIISKIGPEERIDETDIVMSDN